MELTASETTTARMSGLGTGDTNQSYTDIEYAFKLGGLKVARIQQENGKLKQQRLFRFRVFVDRCCFTRKAVHEYTKPTKIPIKRS